MDVSGSGMADHSTMKNAVLFFKLTLLTSMVSTLGQELSPPVRIACIGDSITQGGIRGRDEFTYRWALFRLLVDAGVDFDFVGSKNDGFDADAEWPKSYKAVPFDPDHEGIYGITTRAAFERLPAAVKKWPAPPTMALIHLGTNDLSAGNFEANVIEPLRGIIALLRKQNPRMVILLGHLNFNNDREVILLREAVEKLRQESDTPNSPVRTVNHFDSWNDSDTFDGVHPNAQGQQKMAVKWFEAMRPYLPNT